MPPDSVRRFRFAEPPAPIGREEATGQRGAQGAGSIMTKRLYVGNIPFRTTAEELKALFEQHAEVVSVDVVKDRDSGQPRGFAFVEVESGEQAAIEALNGAEMQGRRIVVNEARPKEPRSGGGGGGRRGGGGGWRDR